MPNHWNIAGFPKLGWTCVGVTDALQSVGNFVTCEMCDAMQIRWINEMVHPTMPGFVMEAGTLCAAIMEKGYNPLAGRQRAQRRKKWLSRRWRHENGVEIVGSKGHEFRVFPSNGGMKWEVWQKQPKPIKPPGVKRMKRPLPVLIHSGHAPGTQDAKLAAFDAVWP